MVAESDHEDENMHEDRYNLFIENDENLPDSYEQSQVDEKPIDGKILSYYMLF